MNRTFVIIIISILLQSCSEDIKMDFKNTEWISDSLAIKNSNHTKEYLFFDSLLNYRRISLWTEDYILEKGKHKEVETGIELNRYLITVIDSFNIKLVNSEFDGYYHGNPWPKDLGFNDRLTGFIVGDSIKKQLIGEWKFIGNEIELSEHLKHYQEIPEFANKKLNRIAFEELENELSLEFTIANELILTNSDNVKRYFRYILDNEEIMISGSDYVITHKYELLNPNELQITNANRNLGKSKMSFKKENTEANNK